MPATVPAATSDETDEGAWWRRSTRADFPAGKRQRRRRRPGGVSPRGWPITVAPGQGRWSVFPLCRQLLTVDFQLLATCTIIAIYILRARKGQTSLLRAFFDA